MLVVDAGLELVESEGRTFSGAGVVGGDQRQRADGGGDGRDGQRTLQEAAAREPCGDDLAHRAIVRRIGGRAVIFLEQAGAEAGVGGAMVSQAVISHGRLPLALEWLERVACSTPIVGRSHFRDNGIFRSQSGIPRRPGEAFFQIASALGLRSEIRTRKGPCWRRIGRGPLTRAHHVGDGRPLANVGF